MDCQVLHKIVKTMLAWLLDLSDMYQIQRNTNFLTLHLNYDENEMYYDKIGFKFEKYNIIAFLVVALDFWTEIYCILCMKLNVWLCLITVLFVITYTLN